MQSEHRQDVRRGDGAAAAAVEVGDGQQGGVAAARVGYLASTELLGGKEEGVGVGRRGDGVEREWGGQVGRGGCAWRKCRAQSVLRRERGDIEVCVEC